MRLKCDEKKIVQEIRLKMVSSRESGRKRKTLVSQNFFYNNILPWKIALD